MANFISVTHINANETVRNSVSLIGAENATRSWSAASNLPLLEQRAVIITQNAPAITSKAFNAL